MNFDEYFENTKGFGVLATSDSDGIVDAAIYARPHVMADGTIAFIMRDRLTHANLQSNPHAAYLFLEDVEVGYKGLRLFLTKTGEEQDSERLYALRRKGRRESEELGENLYLVFFKVDRMLPIVGSGKGGSPT